MEPGRPPPQLPILPRSARNTIERMGIAGRAVMRILGGESVSVLVHVQRADEHRAGGFEPLDQYAVMLRGARSALILEPASVGRPATSNRFLTA